EHRSPDCACAIRERSHFGLREAAPSELRAARGASAAVVLRVGLIIKAPVSRPSQTPRKHANAGKEHPRLGTGDRFLEIFRQASTAVEPSKRSFNHPAS